MSIPSVYLKSDPSILGEINLKNLPYKPYELSILNQEVALNVYDINIQNNTVTFNNFIRYDTLLNKVYVFTNNVWNDISSSYFVSNNIYRVYKINVFQSVITSIKNAVSGTLFPSDFMMYDNPFTKQTPVFTITKANGYYRFMSALGGTDFDENTGEPLRSVDTAGNFLPYVKFIVYKYDGYSQITSAFISDVINQLNANTSVKYSYNDWQDFWENTDFISNMNLYVYNISTNNQIAKVNKIARKNNQPQWLWDIYFYAYQFGRDRGQRAWDRGVAFKLDGTPMESQAQFPQVANEYIVKFTTNSIPSNAYRIYRERIAQKISPDNTKLVSMDFIKFLAFNQPISRDIRYQIDNPTNNFQITIPNDKPTNRIFVYQTSNNRLLHITDWIPKGTTQNVTISYTNNNGVLNVTSNVVQVNPLPVPIPFSFDYNFISYKTGRSEDYNYNRVCPQGSIVTGINLWAGGQSYVQGIEFDCQNPIHNDKYDISNKYDYIGFFGKKTPYISSSSKSNGYSGYKSLGVGNRDVNYIEFYDGQNNSVLGNGWPPLGGGSQEFRCPNNGRIAGFNIYAGGDLNSIEAYCASPTIPKDYSDAITWSKNPINPIEGGNEGNLKTYVCRANWSGFMIPGKIHPSFNRCYYNVPNIGVNSSDNYQLADAISKLTWKSKNDATVKKVEGGLNPLDGTVSYICRVKVDNNGNYNANGPNIALGNEVNNKCYYQYNDARNSDTYELLSRQ